MIVKKCDICGAVCPNINDIREVQIRKHKNIYDNRPTLEKSFDVCVSCVNRFIKGESTGGGTNEG